MCTKRFTYKACESVTWVKAGASWLSPWLLFAVSETFCRCSQVENMDDQCDWSWLCRHDINRDDAIHCKCDWAVEHHNALSYFGLDVVIFAQHYWAVWMRNVLLIFRRCERYVWSHESRHAPALRILHLINVTLKSNKMELGVFGTLFMSLIEWHHIGRSPLASLGSPRMYYPRCDHKVDSNHDHEICVLSRHISSCLQKDYALNIHRGNRWNHTEYITRHTDVISCTFPQLPTSQVLHHQQFNKKTIK